jgi:hypothetical protein
MIFGRRRIAQDAEHAGAAYENRQFDLFERCRPPALVRRYAETRIPQSGPTRQLGVSLYQYYGFLAALRAASKRRM